MAENTPEPNTGLTVALDNDAIVIRLPLAGIPAAAEGSWAAQGMDLRLKITDVALFAAAVVQELEREEEDGTTPVHRLFDKAFEEAAEQGSEGVEILPDEDAFLAGEEA